MTLLLEPHSQEKQKLQHRVRERLGNAGEPGTDRQRENRETAGLLSRTSAPPSCVKRKKTKFNTVCMSPWDSTKTWEGCFILFLLGTLSARLFSFVHFPLCLTISRAQQPPTSSLPSPYLHCALAPCTFSGSPPLAREELVWVPVMLAQ